MMSYPKPILLYDIDGTLLNVKRDFLLNLIADQLERFGVKKPETRVRSFAGRTDRGIFLELIGERDDGEEIFEQLKKSYSDAMIQHLTPQHLIRINDAIQSVESARELNLPVGLCTGNFRSVAMKKVETAGLKDYFPFGGFGGAHENRDFLPGDADRDYRLRFMETPKPEHYVIIGDTPNDIRCAKYFGAMSVAVTTGGFPADQLSQHSPDLILDSLKNPAKWLTELGFHI